MKESKKTQINVELLDKTQDQVEAKALKIIKSHPKIRKLIEHLNISDEEILDNIVDFLNVKDSIECPNIYPWIYNVGRKKGILYIKKIAAKNNFARNVIRSVNLILTDINNPNIDCKLSKMRTTANGRRKLVAKIKEVRELLEKKKPLNGIKNIYIYGANGTGKTYIGSAMANSFSSRGISSAYIRLADLFNFLKSKLNNSISINKILNQLKNVSFLIIDDLGFEKHNNWFKYDFFYEVIQYRNQKNKMTVLLSPFSQLELAQYYRKIEDDMTQKVKLESLIHEISDNFDEFCINENLQTMS
ncbi:ATP-binding protein [Mycoplasmopsis primatum]|uniref:ATP-binding protein n=1 Tax=Mycoplasmopsis primatum TaxID=55604 RepID=UPI00068DAD70|nr:ATP-binding protein [Mycoplasmopsis primatum]